MTEETRPASVADALLIIGSTVTLLALSVALFGSDASGGANQIALVIGAVIAALVALKNGHGWEAVERNIVAGIAVAMPAILILFAVGALIGAWMISGTVPTMIYYGLLLLEPALFFPAACLLCAVVALAIGSSWTVAGTVGVALIGVAGALDLSLAITAGAVISGAYFGDKMSPLSDTTNLAPAVTGTDLFSHIGHMAWTTAPAFVVALAAFALASWIQPAGTQTVALAETLARLDSEFRIGPLMLLPVALVIYLAARRTPAVAVILAGTGLAAVMALLFQQPVLRAFAESPERHAAITFVKGIWEVLFDGYRASTGDSDLDALLSRGGMSSMLTTVWLIIAAMSFGSAAERAGVLDRVLRGLLGLARGTGGLVSATLGTGVGINALASDQYMSIVLTGRMFGPEYRARGLDPKNLSRALEDSATITSPLVPWNTCGAYMAAALGVPTLAYLPFCFFNLLTPLVSAAFGFTGFTMTPTPQTAAGAPAATTPRPDASSSSAEYRPRG
ncbi:MAG: Na+/H+ antiporter NhaC [Pseudomonadota bacterium]